jgi:nifR3 family TIM-barrel protein
MGCPVKKVVRRGAGSALMQTPEKAAVIVKEVQNALAGSIPFSVKFRSGWDNSSLNFLYFGLMMQDSGADFVTLHPRTSRQMFGGLSNWEHIKALKARLNIPVVGNGDLHSPEDAERMLNETRCDGLMIGRGALGKPWIFRQCREFLTSGSYTPNTKNHLLETVVKHLELALQYQREAVVVKEMRFPALFLHPRPWGELKLRNKNQSSRICRGTKTDTKAYAVILQIRFINFKTRSNLDGLSVC